MRLVRPLLEKLVLLCRDFGIFDPGVAGRLGRSLQSPLP